MTIFLASKPRKVYPTEPNRTERESRMKKKDAEKGDKKKGRKKGTGTLVLRNGVFQARWVVGGRLYSRSTGQTNRRAAEKKLDEFVTPFLAKTEAATLTAISERIKDAEERAGDSLRLADAWAAYEGSLERGTVSDFTLGVYRSRVGAFVDWMRGHFPAVVEVRAVTEEHAEAFMREIAAEKSGKTFNDYRAILLQLWRILAHDRRARLEGNPWENIKPRDRETVTRRELTVEELAEVIGSAEGEMRTLFAVGIYTGLRLGDAVGLDWGAVDLVRGFIDATPHKTQKHGTRVHIPIAPVLRSVLECVPPAKRHGAIMPELLFIYNRNANGLTKRIQRHFHRCGIETQVSAEVGQNRVSVGFHSLRHTFVSLCANGGVPLAVVQSIVGHSNPSMTRHYFHVSDAALQGATAALPDVVTVEVEDAEVVEDGDAPEQAAERATRALPGPDATSVRASGSGASTRNLEDLAAVLARMDAGELVEAAKMLNKIMKSR